MNHAYGAPLLGAGGKWVGSILAEFASTFQCVLKATQSLTEAIFEGVRYMGSARTSASFHEP